MSKKYIWTIRFISGTLEGLTIEQEYSFPQRVGFICRKPCAGSSGYVVEACREK